MKLIIVTASAPQNPRLRVRRVDEQLIAELALTRAVEKRRPIIRADHGGGVANGYGYRAETETLVTVAFPDGRVVQWHGRAPANKVTLTFAGDLFDKRCGEDRKNRSLGDWLGRAVAVLERKDVCHPRGRTDTAQVRADWAEATTPQTLD